MYFQISNVNESIQTSATLYVDFPGRMIQKCVKLEAFNWKKNRRKSIHPLEMLKQQKLSLYRTISEKKVWNILEKAMQLECVLGWR